MSGLMFPSDEQPAGGTHDGLCIECDNKARCRSSRWIERPCEVAKLALHKAQTMERTEAALADIEEPGVLGAGLGAPGGPTQPAEPAPWQRPREDMPGFIPPEMINRVPRYTAQGLHPDVVTDDPPVRVGASGATSSGQLPRYDLIPWHIFADRLGRRYTEGAVKHGEFNWQKGLADRTYVLDRANHTLKHLHRAIEAIRAQSLPFPGSTSIDTAITTVGMKDDDLAAAMWGIIFLMAAQRGSADL